MRRVGLRSALAALLAALGSLLVSATPAHAALQPAGGVVLDSWGGIHPFGGVALNTANAPFWPGQDVARALVVLPDGSGGWTLDDWGGIHQFGSAPAPKCPCAYWQGQDVARALVVLGNRTSGYVMDDWGGIHEYGGAPKLTGGPYWPGQDVARGFDVHLNSSGVPDGGWVLDDWGGVHAFGGAPALSGSHYYPGFDYWQKLHATGNGAGAYVVGKYGITDKFGNPPGINWAGESYWDNGDLVRDVVPVNPSGGWVYQPLRRGAASQLMVRLQNFDRTSRGIPALAENATLDGIAGNGLAYNLANCGGPNQLIADRTADEYNRNYYDHAIPGCAGVKYVWDTYYVTYGVSWRAVAENLDANLGIPSLSDSAWTTNGRWLASSPHYTNLTNRAYTQAGCGYYGFWACEFLG